MIDFINKLLTVALFLCCLSTPAYALNIAYVALLDKISPTYEKSIDSGGFSITYHGISSEDGERVLRVVRKSIRLLPQFYKESNVCRDINLHIYQIDYNILNDRRSMSFLDWSSWGDKNIDAAYDGRASPAGTSTIFITSEISGYQVDNIISHEITHFWQHANCLSQNEIEARQFEIFHKRN